MPEQDDTIRPEEILPLSVPRLDARKEGFQDTSGFASPANGHFRRGCDLNDLVIGNKDATYFMRIGSESMAADRIHTGDWIITDADVPVEDGTIVAVWADGGYRVRRVIIHGPMLELRASNPDYLPIYVHEGEPFEFIGVVTFVFHRISHAA